MAHQLLSDYMGYLTNQEATIGRIVDQKLTEMEPRIMQMIKECLREYELPVAHNNHKP